MTTAESLSAPWTMAFSYTRAVGPVVGRFLAGLAQRRVLAVRLPNGTIEVPPSGAEWGEQPQGSDWVQLSGAGELVGFTWIDVPLPTHPRRLPFAFARVRLDGADTPMLHVLDAPSPEGLFIGQRVRIRWAAHTRGHITDIAGFEPHDGATERAASADLPEPTAGFSFPVAAHYDVCAGRALSRHLLGLVEGRFVAARCSRCARVYVPPLGACSVCSLALDEEVVLPDVGTVTTLCIVNLQVRGQEHLERPFASANVLLDGSDTPFLARISGVNVHEVRMGMRVRAQFRPPAERVASLDAIACFVPVDEPDVDLHDLRRAREAAHRA